MKTIIRFFRRLVVGLFLLSIALVVAYRWLPVPVTPLMLIRCAQQVKDGQRPRLRHTWKPLSQISPQLPLAVWAAEDQKFLDHHGFDFKAISQAYDSNQAGGKLRGASTISQQTAKNVFLWPGRSWLRKGLEAYFTVLIELCWNKRRIMEVYLNSVEMGDGIYGAQAVARNHFGCDAGQLTRQQAALVAVSLPNPRKWDSAHPTPYLRKRQQWCIRQMRNLQTLPNPFK